MRTIVFLGCILFTVPVFADEMTGTGFLANRRERTVQAELTGSIAEVQNKQNETRLQIELAKLQVVQGKKHVEALNIKIEGQVAAISPNVDTASLTIQATSFFENKEDSLIRPGMKVTATLMAARENSKSAVD